MKCSTMLLGLIVIWAAGCGRKSATPSVPSAPPESVELSPAKILKVAVYRDGKVEIDGAAVSIEDATQRIGAAAGSGTSVHYYREAGEEEPHPNATKIIGAVIDAKLPISLSSEPDFSTFVDENGTIKPRGK